MPEDNLLELDVLRSKHVLAHDRICLHSKKQSDLEKSLNSLEMDQT